MRNTSETGDRRREYVLAVLILLPIVAWEVYEIWLGDLIRPAKYFPSVILVFACFGSIYAAWNLIQIEYFPISGVFNRKIQIWFTVGLNLWSAGLVGLWLEPRFAIPIAVSSFAITDFLGFQLALDLCHRLAGRSGRGEQLVLREEGRHGRTIGSSSIRASRRNLPIRHNLSARKPETKCGRVLPPLFSTSQPR
jgi:hypothetical protein